MEFDDKGNRIPKRFITKNNNSFPVDKKKVSSNDLSQFPTLDKKNPHEITFSQLGTLHDATRKGKIPCRIPRGFYAVFGSNRQGIHGKGMAQTAMNCWGAKWKRGRGIQGQSYALPTKETPYQSLSEYEVKQEVEAFLSFARRNKDKHFLVGAVGTKNAGFSVKFMKSLFKDARNEPNVILPNVFM